MEQSGESASKLQSRSRSAKLSLPLAILGLIAFFLPWMELSCGGIVIRYSGYDIAAGTRKLQRMESSYDKLMSSEPNAIGAGRVPSTARRAPGSQKPLGEPTQSKGQDASPALWAVPVALIVLFLLGCFGLPRWPTLGVSGGALVYLTYFFVASEQGLDDPKNTGGLIQHHWLLGFWVVCAALLGEIGIALSKGVPSAVQGASAPIQGLAPPEAPAHPYKWAAAASPPPPVNSYDSAAPVAPTPAPAVPRRQTGSVFGLAAGSQAVTTRSREAGTGTSATADVQPPRPATGGANTAGQSPSEQSGRRVYTYEAPGQPLCPECGERPAIFYCTHHSKPLCLQCVVAHDDPSTCQYVPAFRSHGQSGF